MNEQIVFDTRPAGVEFVERISGCYIRNGEEALFLQHAENSVKPYAGKWGLVGGKRQKDETPKETMIRECREETGLRMNEGDLRLYRRFFVIYPPPTPPFIYFVYDYHLFRRFKPTISPEHTDYRWEKNSEHDM